MLLNATCITLPNCNQVFSKSDNLREIERWLRVPSLAAKCLNFVFYRQIVGERFDKNLICLLFLPPPPLALSEVASVVISSRGWLWGYCTSWRAYRLKNRDLEFAKCLNLRWTNVSLWAQVGCVTQKTPGYFFAFKGPGMKRGVNVLRIY